MSILPPMLRHTEFVRLVLTLPQGVRKILFLSGCSLALRTVPVILAAFEAFLDNDLDGFSWKFLFY